MFGVDQSTRRAAVGWWPRCCSSDRVLDGNMTDVATRELRTAWRRRAASAVERVGTPCYIAAWAPLRTAVAHLDALGSIVPIRSWLSFKTHPLPALAAEWMQSGRGIEVVSESELVTVLQIGCTVDQLLVNGVAKHAWLLRHPLRRLHVHFDSLREIDALLALSVACEWRVGVRCHVPDERDAREPQFNGQFGMVRDEAVEALRRLRRAGADVQSIHFHLGQRRQEPGAYSRAINHVAGICQAAGFAPRVVDLGGGLPAQNDAHWDVAMDGLAAAVHLTPECFPGVEEIWLENGRFIANSSAVLAVRVLDVKEREECRYAICDGGRTNHALAADNGPHPILPLIERRPGPHRFTTICGPTCMMDDRLGRFSLPESLDTGDVLLWLDAGAYHLPWETRFSQGLCAVAWFGDDERLTVAREREQPGEWCRPSALNAAHDHV
jgi:diaminopimelate decarboxylase